MKIHVIDVCLVSSWLTLDMTYFTTCSNVSIVEFEHVIIGCDQNHTFLFFAARFY